MSLSIKKKMSFLINLLSDKKVQKNYFIAGSRFGDVVSYLYMGESSNFETLFSRWSKWEHEYLQRGYRSISLDDFIDSGGYGKPIDHLLGIKRQENEDPISHSEKFLVEYKRNHPYPSIDFNSLKNKEVVHLEYMLPSTKNSR